jgi:hypothetical protein
MGTRGPIPKRDEERVRRNKTGEDGLETDTVEMVGKVEVPELDLPVLMDRDGNLLQTHPMVVNLWESLPMSGQAKYWEPSDWQYARIVMFAINELLVDGISAMKLAAVDAMMSKLLLTEADRRRVKIEVQRVEAEAKLVNASERFRERFEAARVAYDDEQTG